MGNITNGYDAARGLRQRLTDEIARCRSNCFNGIMDEKQVSLSLCQACCPKTQKPICPFAHPQMLDPICLEPRPGTRVQVGSNGLQAVVVPDIMGICRTGRVLVELDGREKVASYPDGELEVVEILFVRTSEKCQGCTYLSCQQCLRHTDWRMEAVLNSFGKVLPTRLYPNCQDEVCQKQAQSPAEALRA